MSTVDGDEIPGLCLFPWQQGGMGKRHVCTRRNYPGHHHGCCCGILLTAAIADSIKAARERREVTDDPGDVAGE